ncbi:MAG: fructose-1,6-bisphosphatase [Lachnospiraceae bacterium]|nr:fructose-1,6-bisphosphatase [Lachnospiraceae bacterium]
MRDLDYLRLLSHEFPTATAVQAEMINLRAHLALPKGNEYFFSDLHGEYDGFRHMLRSCSGVIRSKIDATFGVQMSEKDQLELANLIYYPRRVLTRKRREGTADPDWYKTTVTRLISVCKSVSTKHTRSQVMNILPEDYAYAIDELLNIDEREEDKKNYYREIVGSIIDVGAGEDFIICLSDLIQNLLMNHLHIIGDIFDRGPRADKVMEEIMSFPSVDIQWGNHDISWMGAAAGNDACIATVLRIAISYNCFDVLEVGYGINLRPLSIFALETYGYDPCDSFKIHLLEKNKYDVVDYELAAKMCKAIMIIELKLGGQLIKRHPEYGLEDRLLLDKIDFRRGTVKIGGKDYALKDINLPTVDPEDPYRLSEQEAQLVEILRASFQHSIRLQRHIRYLYSHGGMYKVINNNLLFHGCIPMDEQGGFLSFTTQDGTFAGKDLMDYLEGRIVDAYFLDPEDAKKQDAVDLMWYLWCGPVSPLFGKDKMTTFEHTFLEEKELSKENYNAYYRLCSEEKYVDRIFEMFSMPLTHAHIINGHVPVKVKKGEKPVKAGGKVYVIDGGMSKAYHEATGIAGYTLIFNSHHLALAMHTPFVPGEENTPEIQITDVMERRICVRDTDEGKELKKRLDDLGELLESYHSGLLKEHIR